MPRVNAALGRESRPGSDAFASPRRRKLETARRYLDLVSRRWDNTLERLRAAVER